MTTTDRPARPAAAPLLAALAGRVVVADGAMGTMLQASPATLSDFDGHEGCNEILNLTRPDIVRSIHDAYLDAGVDCVTTNTFGANLGNLGEYGLAARIEELSAAGAAIARAAADAASADGRPRWVLGSVGPGTKLPTLGHVRFAELRDAYQRNVAGLLHGGVDAVIVETCQDLLQAKAAVIARRPRDPADRTGDHRDHRGDAARHRDRGRPHRAGTARDQPDRAQLRDRPGRDE
jgi:5-methyltetrahydrofolate--homocysteine methyltransferase